MPTFPATPDKAGKATRGATGVARTPLEIRARPRKLGKRVEADLRDRVTRAFGKWARMIAGITARVEDVNGPKGGADLRLALQVDVTGHAPVHVEHVAPTLAEAEAGALKAGEQAMKRLLGRLGRAAGREATEHGPSLPRALASPRRRRGHEHRNDSRATAVLEDSATKPSRKSTRGSSNRQKAATPKQRTEQLKANAPSAVASRQVAMSSGRKIPRRSAPS